MRRLVTTLSGVCLGLFILAGSLAHAEENFSQQQLKQIIRQEFRPSVKSIAPLLLSLNQLPFPDESGLGRSSLRKTVFKEFPAILARLEYLYPNGTFACLGRDTAFVADLLESFYYIHGIDKRVVRLGASSRTIHGMDSSELREFLVSNGLDLQAAADGSRPYVMIDRTPYTETSQSVLLMKSVFGKLDPDQRERIWTRVNFISSEVGIDIGDLREDQRRRIDQAMLMSFKNGARYPPALRLSSLARVTDVADSEWHNPFGASLVAHPDDGRLTGLPGRTFGQTSHRIAVNRIWEMLHIMQDPVFKEILTEEARRLNFDIWKQLGVGPKSPLEESAPDHLIQSASVGWIQKLKKLISDCERFLR